MYPEALVVLIASPLFLALAVIVAAISTWICKFSLARGLSGLTPSGIVRGYIVALFAAAAMGAVIDARESDGTNASVAFLCYFAVMTLAVLVVPGVALLAAVRRDTIPWAICLSMAISAAIAFVLGTSWSSSGQNFAVICGLVTGLTLVFGMAARLRWSVRRTH
jgi:hypothetical protein